LLREWIIWPLFIPENVHDPPTLAVKRHLKAIDAAGEGRFAGSVAGFIAAEDLRDVAEGLHAADDGVFEESVFQEIGPGEADLIFDAIWANANYAVGRFFGRREAGIGHEKRAEAVPITFSRRSGDHVVERGQNAFDGFDVVGLCGGDTCKWIGRGLLRSGRLLSNGFPRTGWSGAWWVRNGERCGKSEKREFHGEFSRAILLREP